MKYDATLKDMKKTILQKQRKTNLGQLLRANDTSIVEVLKSVGLQTTDCGRFHMWGGCYDKNCSLQHNEMSLTAQQNDMINKALLEGSKKLASKRPKQE